MEAQLYKQGDVIQHTPGSALSAGQIIQVDSDRIGVCDNAIAASALGNVRVKGVFKIEAAAVVGNVGDVIGWDENGSSVLGTASAGAATTSLVDADFMLGSLVEALAAADGYAYVAINEFVQDRPAWPNRVHELKADNYTVDVEDSGKVLHIATDAKTFTLPDCTTCPGLDVIFQNDAADAGIALNISPAVGDKIMGPDVAGTDNKDQINTKLTAVRGDWMHLRSEGVAGWWIIESRGTWAEEAG